MHIERLTKLAELLESHNGHLQFKHGGTEVRFDLTEWQVADDCGTACCAIGLAMLDPWFRAQGLESWPDGWPPSYVGPKFRGIGGYAAAHAFLEISGQQFTDMFCRDSYDAPPTPSDVAARIRALITHPRREEIEG